MCSPKRYVLAKRQLIAITTGVFTPVSHSSAPSTKLAPLRRFVTDTAGTTTLLLGFDPRTAFAVARSLHRQNIRVVVATLAEWETPVPSQAVAAYLRLPSQGNSPEDFLRQLLRAIDNHRVDTLIPLTDRALIALAPHQEVLRQRLKLLAPTSAQTSLILNKTATAQLAAELGIPVPSTIVIEDPKELDQLDRRVNFPVFLKPENKASSCSSRALPGPDVFLCSDLAVLRAQAHVLERSKRVKFLVQERFPGDDVGLAVVMHRGEAVSVFQYRARRTWPVDGGVCVAATSEKLHPGMAECAIRLLRALGWEGVAELDFRHDRQTDGFALLEINGRFWGSSAAAVAAGADMPWVVWQLAHGRTPQAERYEAEVGVRWLEGDLRRLSELASRATGITAWRRLLRELAIFFWDFRPGIHGMYWSWRDSAPGFHSARIFAQWWCIARVQEGWARVRRPKASLARRKDGAVPVLSP